MRTVAYCGDYTALTTTKFGDGIYVDTRDTSLAPHIMLSGDWEPWVTNAMKGVFAKIGDGATFIDVGANFGWYTLFAHRVGKAARVFAFEPNPRLFDLLCGTLSINGMRVKTTLSRYACTEVECERFLEFSWQELGGGLLTAIAKNRDRKYESVMGTTLDVAVDAERLQTNGLIIKIDVEGGEVDALRGATKLLERKPVLFVEHHQHNVEALWDLIGSRYAIRHAQHSGHQGPPLSLNQAREIGDAETLICTPVGT